MKREGKKEEEWRKRGEDTEKRMGRKNEKSKERGWGRMGSGKWEGGMRNIREEKGNREQRTEDRKEGLAQQRRRNGEDTVRCEGDGEEGGRLEKRRREDR